MAERDSHAAEPPATVAAAMLAADVVIAPTVQSLSHTAARKAASEAGVRIATMPGVTEEMLARVMGADMRGAAAPRRRRSARCSTAAPRRASPAPTAATCGSGWRRARSIVDAGDLSARGAFGNLPCGEGFIAPLEGTGEGTLVVDGSIAGVGRVEEHGDAHRSRRAPDRRDRRRRRARCSSCSPRTAPDGTNVAELGIGTNEEAILTGNILEDEKILGTAHVAFGASAAIGGTVQVPVHLDCVVLEPTVEIDGEALVRDGELLV